MNVVTGRVSQQDPEASSTCGLPRTFNDWTPGAHKLVQRSNGTRSVTVAVPRGQSVRFRYLGEGGVWFDDEDADAITPEGSGLTL